MDLKKIIVVLISFILSFDLSNAKDPKYPVSDIDENLKKNAKAVIRNHSTRFIVESERSGKMEITYAITILKKPGLRYSKFAETYNKFSKIRNIKGTYYDKNGKQIKRLKRNDLIDVPAIAGFSLYEDSRAILYDPDIKNFPYTVEYSFTIDYDGFLFYPSWYYYSDFNISVEHKQMEIEVPNGVEIRTYSQNFNAEPDISNVDEKKIYKWAVNNLPAIKEEPYSPELLNYAEVLFLAPDEFEIGGTKGRMDSWKSFGDWICELNLDRDYLPEETVNEVKELVKDAESDQEKVKILYTYMQDKTRYVSIQIGIGGWQPFEAKTVDRLSYGDCKALSNYMYALLKAVGVKSVYTLVRAGENAPDIVSDFAMTQFNHAILCVPFESDTMWLECTNQKIPAGYTGKFTDDRDVLLIKENESEIVHSRVYSKDENRQVRGINVNLEKNGSCDVNSITTYIGLKTDEVYYITDAADKDKKMFLYDNIQIPDFNLIDYSFNVNSKMIPEIEQNVTLKVNNYCSTLDNKLIVPLNMMNKLDIIPRRIRNRQTDFIIRRSSVEIDSISYKLPEGFEVEYIPQDITLESEFGTYKTEIKIKENEIIYKRMLEFNKCELSSEAYDDFIEFMTKVSNYDSNKLILKSI